MKKLTDLTSIEKLSVKELFSIKGGVMLPPGCQQQACTSHACDTKACTQWACYVLTCDSYACSTTTCTSNSNKV